MVASDFTKLTVGCNVDAIVAVLSCQSRPTKKDTTFLICSLGGSCGNEIVAKRWNVMEPEIEETKALLWGHVKGKITAYEGTLELELAQPIVPVQEPANASSYLPASPISQALLLARLDDFVESVIQPQLKALLVAVFKDDRKIRSAFARFPAAEERHHAFRHGLLQHTLEVADIVDAIATKQQGWGGRGRFSRDLAVTGALLHDIGKLEEYEERGHGITFSTSGNFLGHMNQGVLRIARKIATLNKNGLTFSKDLEEIILHLITSHHGKAEYGAPKPPMIAEAAVLHYADMMSAELFYFAEAGTKAEVGTPFYKQWKLDGSSGRGGRPVFVGPLAGIWDDAVVELHDDAVTASAPPSPTPTMPSHSLPLLRTMQHARTAKNNFVTVRLPLLGVVAAGLPIESMEMAEDIDIDAGMLRLGCDSCYLLRVKGDSMTGDGIQDGDLIVVRHQVHADHGDLVVAKLDEGATVKRLSYQDGQIALLPSNSHYNPILVPDPNALEIQGRVVAIVR